MSTRTVWDSANDSASHVFTTSTFDITTTSVTSTTTIDIATAAAAAAADAVTTKDETLSPPAHVTGYSEVQTTVTPSVLSSTDTSGAATPDLSADPSKPGTTDGSGDMESSGGVITDKPTTPLDRWTSFVPSSSSAAGKPTMTSLDNGTSNGTVATSHGVSQSDSLIIVLPICLALFFFIVVIIALALYCYRRKRKKQAEHHSNEDLWVKPPTDSLAPLSISSAEPSVPDQLPEKSVPAPERPLYKVVHEFPAPQDTQLPLAIGDLLAVDEKADNGWWRGYVLGKSELSGWFPSSFVEEIKDKNTSTNQSSLAAVDMEVESGPSRHASISSFLIRKKHDDNLLRENSFSLGTLSTQNKAAALQGKTNPILQSSSPGTHRYHS
ncbi:cell wall integrity and stress response component 2-like isoform X2 [Pomacea canaliculata]|uniref:cell wall integrity and stress response component 2-like isoform X2 n=1 Tax=Pomacea canaliculata TaxID=400727 RepID=UPI000D72C551|nr:cell wall integrity and stress response component 2-like isoform X2 [Pomacea canaliculata]XP_025085970.1 cell wall integrity and stress response component 2-like isoform X2 [Pomacea canaliculata]